MSIDDDKFAMHADYPLDASMLSYARQQGFDGEKTARFFEEWRDYWVGRPDEMRTARGWMATWQRHLREKAKRVVAGKPSVSKPEAGYVAPGNGKKHPYTAALDAIETLRKHQPLTDREREALAEWGGPRLDARAERFGVSLPKEA